MTIANPGQFRSRNFNGIREKWRIVAIIGICALSAIPAHGNLGTSGMHSPDASDTVLAAQCLERICDSGADDHSISDTRALIRRLSAEHTSSADHLVTLLDKPLAYLEVSGFKRSNTPSDLNSLSSTAITPGLLANASAACFERRGRKSGDIVLSFAGDCTFGTVNGDNSAIRFPAVYQRAELQDYPFHLVRPWFINDDLTVVNFECTLTNAVSEANKQWHFKGDARYADIFPESSVELVGLANNHSMDYRQQGFNDTVAAFTKAHEPVFYRNAPYITTLKGVQTVIIGDCTVVGENTTDIDDVPSRVTSEIQRFKKPNNIVIVVMHWGSELDKLPRPWQQTMARQFVDAGADAVVGAHPHVLQGIELYKGKCIAYSLGNFAFGGNSHARNPDTAILRLRFKVADGKTLFDGMSVVPCWITSSPLTNTDGVKINNYQPIPLYGANAKQAMNLILARSAPLAGGVKSLSYFAAN